MTVTAVPDFAKRLDQTAEDTEALLARLLADAALPDEIVRPKRLMDAMRYSTLGGGKRLRPFLVVESSAVFGVAHEAALLAGAALECIHCYSLIHDDLPAMDNSDLRRGRPTLHKKTDDATAILAGDGLLTLAFDIISRDEIHNDPTVRLLLTRALARASGIGGMVGGQMLDLAGARRFRALDLRRQRRGATRRGAIRRRPEELTDADGRKRIRRSRTAPVSEHVETGPRGLCQAAHFHCGGDRHRVVLFAAGLAAAGDAAFDVLGWLYHGVSHAGLHHDIPLRTLAYPPQRGATGRRPLSDPVGDRAWRFCQHRGDRVRTRLLKSKRSAVDAGHRDNRAVMGGGAYHLRIALRSRLLPRRQTRRPAVSKRRRTRPRRLLGFRLLLVRHRHDRAGLRRRHYRQDHPPHRHRARHHLICFQHRAAGADGQHRRECDLREAKRESRPIDAG